ncbi:ATP-dependent endonuclease [Flavobacterium sp. 102]|uniref:ATP-dependent nuclease n=1 Tax=Flavobacterium sp. 102 TaxID=2135623 RepID=UPI000EAFD0BB|nr:ATP-dependent endonuclease [Flavobacterium sp. 102]RKS01675.1 putative ATP-dependent endonuclease of OLD family [Flavobacterium sp. 102]
MKIKKLYIENFRILENFTIDLEDEISLIIGKNNSGKTSILTILDKFLNQPDSNRFNIEDFNLNFVAALTDIIEDPNELIEEDFIKKFCGIKLRILIEYFNSDNFSKVQKLMLDLDPDNNFIVLGFDYYLNYENYLNLRNDYSIFKAKEVGKKSKAGSATPPKKYIEKTFKNFLKLNFQDYFLTKRKSIFYDRINDDIIEENFISIEDVKLSDLINFKHISAKRDVTNKETDKTLSLQTSKIYEKKETEESEKEKIEEFQDTIINTDDELSKIYESFFGDIISKIRTLGGIKENDSVLSVLSTLQSKELLKGNTTVFYKHDTHDLPEQFNGLGYLNLISMIFEIEIKKYEFQKSLLEIPSEINLLFIEEPEAHTHPQMQYVFIKNIKTIVGNVIEKQIKNSAGTDITLSKSLQCVISTHSSHIVADSNFDDIKYLRKIESNVESRNLKELKVYYDKEGKHYQFLKQYLTISRAEIFFADKAILIEGDTERILLPTIMKKIDIENLASDKTNKKMPLLSQNISIIEVGAFSQIFELFIDFIGIKSLIITDLDATKLKMVKNKNGKDRSVPEACRVSDGNDFSNSSLKYFLKGKTLSDLKTLPLNQKCLIKDHTGWVQNDNGILCLVYQTECNGYFPRSFEDSFFAITNNLDFVKKKLGRFKGIKNPRYFVDATKDIYDLANECIDKKTHFALDIIYNSNEDYSNWDIPEYIKEGLLWLKEN